MKSETEIKCSRWMGTTWTSPSSLSNSDWLFLLYLTSKLDERFFSPRLSHDHTSSLSPTISSSINERCLATLLSVFPSNTLKSIQFSAPKTNQLSPSARSTQSFDPLHFTIPPFSRQNPFPSFPFNLFNLYYLNTIHIVFSSSSTSSFTSMRRCNDVNFFR